MNDELKSALQAAGAALARGMSASLAAHGMAPPLRVHCEDGRISVAITEQEFIGRELGSACYAPAPRLLQTARDAAPAAIAEFERTLREGLR